MARVWSPYCASVPSFTVIGASLVSHSVSSKRQRCSSVHQPIILLLVCGHTQINEEALCLTIGRSLIESHKQSGRSVCPSRSCSFVFLFHLTVTNFNLNYFFFLPSFILLNQNPFVSLFFCTFFLFPWLPLSLRCTLSISPSVCLLCLSHSVLIFLILLSSLPPFLLLYPTPSSLGLLSLFTFICLSPFSPLQACHSIMLFFPFLTYGERKVSSVALSILHF